MILLLAACLVRPSALPPEPEDLPSALPGSLRAGTDGTVEIWSGGDRWTRTLADGAFLDGGSAEWRLSGGWRIDGQTVSRGERHVWTSSQRVNAAASSGDTLWLIHSRGFTRLAGRARYTQLPSTPGLALTPLGDGLAFKHSDEVVLLDSRGRERCRAKGGGSPSASSPTGDAVVVLGKEGLAVRDLSCELIAGAPITGRSAGFIDAQQLVVLGKTGELIVLSWPDLGELSRTAPAVDATWSLAQGPAGPVLVSGRFVYDPQTATTLTLPKGSLFEASTGLAFVLDGADLRVLDLAGTVQRSIFPGLPSDPIAAVVDGDRMVLADGKTVVQSTAEGTVDRWELSADGLRLLPDGAVEAWTEDSEDRWLLRLGEPPVPAPFLAEPGDLVLANGGRLPLALPADGGPRTVVADAQSARVIDSSTLELLGTPIPGWFELVALSPDGRLFVGLVGDRLRAYEVATARELWSVEAEPRLTRLSVFPGYVAAETDDQRTLLDVRSGQRIWTLGFDDGRGPRPGEPLQIESAAGIWRSDAWGGWTSPPQWPRSVLELAPPARGVALTEHVGAEVIAQRSAGLGPIAALPARVTAELCRLGLGREEPRVAAFLAASCPPPSEAWPPTASAEGEPAPPLRRFTPGRVIADELAAAEDAGLEEVNGEPGPALTPSWTLQAPSTIERLEKRAGSELLVATATSAAILGPDGRVRGAERPTADVASASPWFPVPGGWCLTGGSCSTTDPGQTWPLSAGTATLVDRTLTAPTWQLDGVVRVLPLSGPGFLVQLGSEAGPWVLLDEDGRLGALLGHGHTAVVGEGIVGVARGEVLRVFVGRF